LTKRDKFDNIITFLVDFNKDTNCMDNFMNKINIIYMNFKCIMNVYTSVN